VFWDAFPVLDQFLSAYFPELDATFGTDAAATAAYREVTEQATLAQTIVELERLAALQPLPVKELARATNRYFASELAAREFLANLRRLLCT